MKHTVTKLAHGEGSLGYEASRQCHTLRHSYGGKAHTERSRKCPGGKDECAAREAELKTARNRRRRDMDVRGSLLGALALGSVCEEWIDDECSDGATSTKDGYVNSVRFFVKRLGAEVELEDLTAEIVRDRLWRHLVVALKRKRATVTKYRTHWNRLLDFAVEAKRITPATAAALRANARSKSMPKAPHQPTKHEWHTIENYNKVRSYLTRSDATVRDALFLTMLLCGLRPGEAEGLKWEYVHLDSNMLDVQGCISATDDGRAYTTILKTDHIHRCAHRQLPIAPDLKVVLNRLKLQADPAAPDAEFVFVEVDGRRKGRRINENTIRKHTVHIALETGTKLIPPNGGRHTFASVCLHNGMRPEDLAVLMGHQDTTEIIETYGHPLSIVSSTDMSRFLSGAG